MARALMLQGTGSDVGKSLLLAGMARAYTRRGLRVRPFKPQNMSNNAAVTAEGGEIGRAQALQARACGIAPASDMNPVLLKPQSDQGAQIVLGGEVWGSASAADYRRLAPSLLAGGARRLRPACRGGRSGAGRGRRQPGRDQSARRRHRQYGLCRGGRHAGRADRRHRARRGHRPAGRDPRAAVRQRTRPARRLHRQQVPRRHPPVRRRHRGARHAHRAAFVRHGAVLSRRRAIAGRRFAGPLDPHPPDPGGRVPPLPQCGRGCRAQRGG